MDIHQLIRQVIVHSYIYYELNDNIITDSEFDKKCIELDSRRKELKETKFNDIFTNWDSSTGFTLIRPDLEDYHAHFYSLSNRLIRYRCQQEQKHENS